MKRNFTTLLLLALLYCTDQLNAQSNFKLELTNFIGAMSSDPQSDWTKTWTNFDPSNTVYPEPTDTITLNGMLSSLPVPGELNIDNGQNLVLSSSKVYLLKGIIVVRNGGKLIIPAGTIIRAQADLNSNPRNYAAINVERGGKIECLGTENNPIIFTSAKPVGQRNRGDWGGIVLAGRSTHNLLDGTTNNNVQMEGYNNISFDPDLARFGGNNVHDNSGILRYIRIEFAGVAFETNKEINALTFGAVCSATEVNHIQVSFSGDDSFEWFGGTVNASHLIAWKGTDDDFDTDNGFSGLNQYGIGVKDSAYYDLSYLLPSGSSTSEGFESDNEATGTANVSPATSAVFSNFTMIGPVPVGSKYSDMNTVTKSAFRRGARIRRNSSLRIVNSIFMGYRNFLMIDGDSCIRNTNYLNALNLVSPSTPVDIKTKQISFSNNIIVNTAAAFTTTTDSSANGLIEVSRSGAYGLKLNALDQWIKTPGLLANKINPVYFTEGSLLVRPLASSTTPDFRPVSDQLVAGAAFYENPVLTNLVSTKSERQDALFSAVYPNPVSQGILNFGKEVSSYGIFDLQGKLLSHGFSTDHADVSGLPSGIYFIKIQGSIQKFMIN
jgi:hypothetical protein